MRTLILDCFPAEATAVRRPAGPTGSGARGPALLCSGRLQLLLSMLLFLFVCAPQSAIAQYRLDSGDVLDISVFGRTDLNRRTTIDADGNISVPLIGELHAAGMSLTTLRAKMKELLAASDAVRGSDVIVDLIEYRPFYVYGQVERAGAYPYRPKMTVRHALALAGGIRIVQPGTNNAPLANAELRGRYNMLLAEAAKQQVRIAGLQAEIEGRAEIDSGVLPQASTQKGTLAELVELEKQNLEARNAEREKELEYLERALKLADNHVAALDRGQKQDEEAAKQQVEELARIVELSRKGLAAPGRVADEQRAAVLLKSREMDTTARLALARQGRAELERKMEMVDDRKRRIPRELQDAIASLAAIHSQIKAVGEQLVLSGNAVSQVGEEQSAPEITIFRKKGDAQVRIVASEDSEVEPGDVVEIKLQFDLPPMIAAN